MVDHDAKFTSDVFSAFAKSMGSCLIVGSAYHKNTNAKVEQANGQMTSSAIRYVPTLMGARTTGTGASR